MNILKIMALIPTQSMLKDQVFLMKVFLFKYRNVFVFGGMIFNFCNLASLNMSIDAVILNI